MKLKKYVTEDGLTDEAPRVLTEQSWIYAPLIPVWVSFNKLSRGRPYSAMGFPMPIPYRDMADELTRCSWPHKRQLERWLMALDDEFLALASKQSETSSGAVG
mgnify:CR=1 FL=1